MEIFRTEPDRMLWTLDALAVALDTIRYPDGSKTAEAPACLVMAVRKMSESGLSQEQISAVFRTIAGRIDRGEFLFETVRA